MDRGNSVFRAKHGIVSFICIYLFFHEHTMGDPKLTDLNKEKEHNEFGQILVHFSTLSSFSFDNLFIVRKG